MNTERFMYVRTELIKLYRIITKQTFVVYLPLSSFLTLSQLEHMRDNPPIQGFEMLEQPIERPYTIDNLLRAIKITDGNVNIGFRNPRQDIPLMFDTIQNWVKYWCEIKGGAPWVRTPPISELALIEKLGRHIFGHYKHYHYEKINDTLNIQSQESITLLDILKGRMMFGEDIDNDISYISYLDEYKSSQGYSPETETDSGYLNGYGGGL